MFWIVPPSKTKARAVSGSWPWRILLSTSPSLLLIVKSTSPLVKSWWSSATEAGNVSPFFQRYGFSSFT